MPESSHQLLAPSYCVFQTADFRRTGQDRNATHHDKPEHGWARAAGRDPSLLPAVDKLYLPEPGAAPIRRRWIRTTRAEAAGQRGEKREAREVGGDDSMLARWETVALPMGET